MRDISHALIERGHEVRVLAVENRPSAPPYLLRRSDDGPVHVDRVNLPYFMSGDPDGWQIGLRAWRRHERRVAAVMDDQIDRWRPDIVQYGSSRPFGEEGPIAIGRRGVPIVAVLHEGWFICPRMNLLRSPTAEVCSGPGPIRCPECIYSHYDGNHTKAALKLSWRVPRLGVYPMYRLARRRAARRALAGAIGPSSYITKVHQPHINGDTLHLALGVSTRGAPTLRPVRPGSPLRFGFVGGFQRHKGVWDVLDAAQALNSDGLSFELHIWGPGQEGQEGAIAARGLSDRVRLAGMYEPEERWGAYNEVDVVVLATTVPETLSLVPLEAAVVGVPAIAPAVGGFVESVHDGVNGLLYQFRDASDLQRQMRRILEDPGLFARLSAQSTTGVETRSRGAAIEEALMRIVGRANDGGPDSG